MTLDIEASSDSANEADLRFELTEVTRALRAHVEVLMQGGAFGVPKAAPPAVASITEPPASMAPAAAPPMKPARATAEPMQRSPEFSMPAPQLRVALPVAQPRIDLVALSPEEKQQRLDALKQRITGCTLCRLHEQRTQTVFARGTASSGLCFVGEGPGADEDAQGYPFVGAAGQLLDKMISAMGMTRDEVYVCNIVKCRPPENRKPLPDEMSTCRGYLDEQLELVAPQVIVALGATAVEGLLGSNFGGITRLRGTWKLYKGRIAVMPTFHPAYLLRAPSGKHAVWEDMQAVLRHLGRPLPERGRK